MYTTLSKVIQQCLSREAITKQVNVQACDRLERMTASLKWQIIFLRHSLKCAGKLVLWIFSFFILLSTDYTSDDASKSVSK